jgi:glycerophosphoryl diester phosphodiesterase
MPTPDRFDLQGHRGARGLRPENTLPSFEVALDAGVTSVETDVQLTRDGVPVLCHDPALTERTCRPRPPGPAPFIASLTLDQLRGVTADRNPDPRRFPDQLPVPTPLAQWFADRSGLPPFGIPTLADLFAFAAAYAGEPGRSAGKTDAQRETARRLRFELELKRFPFHAARYGEAFSVESGGALERQTVAVVRAAGLVGRVGVRSFDHRSVRAAKRLEPGLTTAVLVAGTAPVDPVALVHAAGASVYCPDYTFLDRHQVEQLHAVGLAVVPWTVNDPDDWRALREWGVDGICTDFPGQMPA